MCILSILNGDFRAVGRRILGLTWQDVCSREAHVQAYRGFYGREPPPGWFDSDPPSVTQPPPGWTPPPLTPEM